MYVVSTLYSVTTAKRHFQKKKGNKHLWFSVTVLRLYTEEGASDKGRRD